MKMKLDNDLVKSERRKRAWSQEHLANACDLGLRTIQRIEKTGAASYESIKALASVFELGVEDLAVVSVSTRQTRRYGSAILKALAAALTATLAVLLVSSNSWAESVLLDVGIYQNNEQLAVGQLVTAEGKDAEMRIDETIRLVISPAIQDDGKVFLSAKIYQFRASEFVLVSEPKLITANDKAAEIRIQDGSGGSFKFLISPHLSD